MLLLRGRALLRFRSIASKRLYQVDLGAELKYGEALAKYTTDLTEIARSGRSDPVIGRTKEIQRTIQVLSRRTKNNPLLLGQPGTGKTALVEGLAQRIASGDVPDSVKDKKVLSLDLSAIVAGAAFKGEFEKRFKALISDVVAQTGNVILFADEIHQLVGMGASGPGSPMDAANIIKPALARGDLHLLGATTFEEYRKYIESDSALSRRFQPVLISEPSVEDTIAILRGIKDKYELWHGVRISDSAVVAASKLAKRYLTERKLPDSAIDLMDEASSRLRMEKESKPENLASLDREIMILQIELAALKKETDQESFERKKAIESSLKTKQKKSEEMNRQWQIEKDRRQQAITVREKLEASRHELDQAQSRGDYAKAGELKYSIIPKLESQVHSLLPLLLSESVTDQSIATVVSQQTGVAVSRLLEGESERLLHMEDALQQRVVGQDEAITAVCNAVRVSRAGLHAPSKPIGSFLFLGSSGCGKTELAKALAEFLFDQESAIVRLDMSEYSESHSVSRLIGAPPGYVGYDEGGQLTEPIRLRPFSVILLDEIEKAHRQVTNVLLQVLDEGRLTDGSGRTVDFRNTLLIMTSNLGGGLSNTVTMDAVRAHFPPEFVNRLDETICFNFLSMQNMFPICNIQLDRIISMAYSEKRIKLELSEEAKQFLAKEGYQREYGARPLRRILQREILNPLAKLLLSGAAEKEDTVRVSLSGSSLKFDIERKESVGQGKNIHASAS